MKKILLLMLSLLFLFSGCTNVCTCAETTSAESSSFETEYTSIWDAKLVCDPLPENVAPEDIILTLGGTSPLQPMMEDGKHTYCSTYPVFEVTIKNNGAAPIDVYNLIFLEQYIASETEDAPGTWKRVPFDYTQYFRNLTEQTTIQPNEKNSFVFHNDMYTRYTWPADPQIRGSFFEDFEYRGGNYRFAIYMDGGVRYLEFPLKVIIYG